MNGSGGVRLRGGGERNSYECDWGRLRGGGERNSYSCSEWGLRGYRAGGELGGGELVGG